MASQSSGRRRSIASKRTSRPTTIETLSPPSAPRWPRARRRPWSRPGRRPAPCRAAAAALAAQRLGALAHQVDGGEARGQVVGDADDDAALPSSVTADEATTPEPTCFLPSSTRLRRSFRSMPDDRAREELHAADARARRPRRRRPAPPPMASFFLRVGELALELLRSSSSAPTRPANSSSGTFSRPRHSLGELRPARWRCLARRLAGQRLDPAHAGGDARCPTRPRRSPMSPVRRTCVPPQSSTDQPERIAAAARPSPPRAPRRRTSRRTARARPTRRASSSAISRVVTGAFCSTIVVGDVLDAARAPRRHRLRVREVEAQPVGRDQRALLRDVVAEHLAQRLVQQMRRGMVCADRGAPRVIDRRARAPRRPERALLDRAEMHEQIAGLLLRVGDREAHAIGGRSRRCRRPGRRTRHRTASG